MQPQISLVQQYTRSTSIHCNFNENEDHHERCQRCGERKRKLKSNGPKIRRIRTLNVLCKTKEKKTKTRAKKETSGEGHKLKKDPNTRITHLVQLACGESCGSTLNY